MKLIILSDTHIKPGQSLLEMLPDVVKELLEIGSEVCTEYANALFERGADAISIPDSEGIPDRIPPPLFESLILPEHRKLTGKTRGMMILHMCGDATDILEPGCGIAPHTPLMNINAFVEARDEYSVEKGIL